MKARLSAQYSELGQGNDELSAVFEIFFLLLCDFVEKVMRQDEKVVRSISSGFFFRNYWYKGPNSFSAPFFWICIRGLSDHSMVETTVLKYSVPSIGSTIHIHSLPTLDLARHEITYILALHEDRDLPLIPGYEQYSYQIQEHQK